MLTEQLLQIGFSYETTLRKFIEDKLDPDIKDYTDKILEDTYLAMEKCIVSFKGNTDVQFKAWLKAIAFNKIRDLSKKIGEDFPRFASLESVITNEEGDEMTMADIIPSSAVTYLGWDTTLSPSEHLQQKEAFQLFQTAIDSLSGRDRQIIYLRLQERKSFEEIRDIMHYETSDPDTVKVAFFRAIKHLQKLTKQCDLDKRYLQLALRENDIWDIFHPQKDTTPTCV